MKLWHVYVHDDLGTRKVWGTWEAFEAEDAIEDAEEYLFSSYEGQAEMREGCTFSAKEVADRIVRLGE